MGEVSKANTIVFDYSLQCGSNQMFKKCNKLEVNGNKGYKNGPNMIGPLSFQNWDMGGNIKIVVVVGLYIRTNKMFKGRGY